MSHAAFLYLEAQGDSLAHRRSCIFEGEIPFDKFVRAIDSRLHLLPRYRQVVAEPPFHIGYPSWQDDPDFDIGRHMFRVRLDPPRGQVESEAMASPS